MKHVGTILLIDNQKEVNLQDYSLLKDSNISTDINYARGVEEAIMFIYNNNTCPDLILVNLELPNLDGYDFLDLFKWMQIDGYKNSLIYVFHEFVEFIDVKRLFHTGIAGVLIKPLTVNTVKKIFKRMAIPRFSHVVL